VTTPTSTEPARPGPVRAELRTGVAVALGVAAAGLPTGLVWFLLAPLPRLVVRSNGIFFASEGETAIAADGWFAVCAATAGLVSALVVFAVIRRARLGALVGLTVGSLLGVLVAWRLGVLLGPAPAREAAKGLAVGTRFDGPLKVSARGVLLVWPLVAVVAYFALTAGLEPPSRRRGDAAAEGADPSAGRRFPVTVLRPGYVVEEVDDLLRRVEAGRAGAEDIRAAQFTATRLHRGYDEATVDAALTSLELSLIHRDPVDG
jgi:DivIVA domain-containing protein